MLAYLDDFWLMAIVTLLQELFSGRAMRQATPRVIAPVERIAMPKQPALKC